MKYLTVLVTVLFLSACGDDNFINMCGAEVDPGPFEIRSDLFCQAVRITEHAVNRRRLLTLDLYECMRNKDLKVKYLPPPRPKGESGGSLRGLYYSDRSIELWPDSGDENKYTPWGLCIEMYYVLGHELLHFLAEEELSERDKGKTHDIPDLFLQGAWEIGLYSKLAAEFDIWIDINEMCVKNFGDPKEEEID